MLDKQSIKANCLNAISPSLFSQHNRNRYLVFFDDGYASYVQHAELRLVCWQAANVWEDVHADSREFIRNYLAQVCRVLCR